MGYCVDCGKEICKGHGQKRCTACAKKRLQDSHGYPKYYDFAKTLTLDELRALVTKHRADINAAENYYQVLEHRTLIKILTEVYSRKNEEKENAEY